MSAAPDHRCACGAPVRIPGLPCDGCEHAARKERSRAERQWRAQRALPLRYRGNALDADVTAARCRDATGVARVLAGCSATTERITLVGPAGVGKTTLAAAAYALLLMLRDRGEGFYAHARELALARDHHRLGSEAPLVESALEAEVCILDDLGVEGDVRNSAIGDVVYARHNRCAPTIFTTTLTPAQLAAAYGDGIMRRVYEAVEGSHVIMLAPTKGAR